MKKWKKLESNVVYDSKYFKVRKDKVKLPDGKVIDWTYWDSSDSAMVIGMTGKQKLIMIRQYRYMADREVIEFPAGSNEKAETIEVGAIREFEEETGYTCKKLTKLGSFYETYGQLNRKIHLFFSNDAEKLESEVKVEGQEVDEDITVVLVDFEEAVSYALENKILAMGCALAVLLLKAKVESGEIKI